MTEQELRQEYRELSEQSQGLPDFSTWVIWKIGALKLEVIEACVWAERERCAQIAEHVTCVYSGPPLRTEGFDLAKVTIAAEIRKASGTHAAENKEMGAK